MYVCVSVCLCVSVCVILYFCTYIKDLLPVHIVKKRRCKNVNCYCLPLELDTMGRYGWQIKCVSFMAIFIKQTVVVSPPRIRRPTSLEASKMGSPEVRVF